MAWDLIKQEIGTFRAGEDMTAALGKAVVFNSFDRWQIAGVTGPLENIVHGLLVDNPANGKVARVQIAGVAAARLGGAVTGGRYLSVDLNGDLIEDHPGGSTAIALESGIAGSIIPVLLQIQNPTGGGGGVVNHQKELYESMGTQTLIKSDFMEATTLAEGVAGVSAGFASGVFPFTGGDFSDHPGIWRLSTGTNAAGRVFVISRFPSIHVGVGGVTRVGTWVKTDPVLSDGTNRYTLRNGFFSITLPNVIVNGIGFEYVDNENGGRWQAICFDGAETSVDTGITVAADTWYKCEAEINAAGSSVEFFIDNVSVATITTNIPAGSSFPMFYNTHIMKLLGTTTRSLYLDAYYVYQELTR